MILKKQEIQTARWNTEANNWWIGSTTEYKWLNERTKEQSSWMDFDSALVWIKEHDEGR